MGFLKKIFGGGGGSAPSASSGLTGKVAGDPKGLYFFVQPDNCDEVVRLRVNGDNDLSLKDDETGYWVHKVVRGTKCFNGVEVDLFFDMNRRLTDSQLKGGKLVDEAAYTAWMVEKN
jgi:hypothetical protein